MKILHENDKNEAERLKASCWPEAAPASAYPADDDHDDEGGEEDPHYQGEQRYPRHL